MRVIKLFSLLSAVVVISGCSLTGGGNDGGIFRSDDGGKNFSQKVSIDQNGKKASIGVVDTLSISVNPQNGSELYIGTKANGILKTNDAGENWQSLKVAQTTAGKVYAIAIDPSNPQTVFATVVVDQRAKIIRSDDAGANWKDIYTEPAGGSVVLSLALSPQNSQNIYAGTDQGQIIFSENGGETWRHLDWTQSKQAVYRITTDYFNPQIVYFALFQNGILRTKDGGRTFEELGKNMAPEKTKLLNSPTVIVVDKKRPGWVYAGTSEGLIRSKDNGDNWDIIRTLNQPQEQIVRSIEINPQNSDEIIFSVSQAFYKSNDGGISWMTTQFNTTRTLDVVAYNQSKPEVIYVGLNKR
jgi:photosystem II stability/assembly factor-like uncharacterized protein